MPIDRVQALFDEAKKETQPDVDRDHFLDWQNGIGTLYRADATQLGSYKTVAGLRKLLIKWRLSA